MLGGVTGVPGRHFVIQDDRAGFNFDRVIVFHIAPLCFILHTIFVLYIILYTIQYIIQYFTILIRAQPLPTKI